MHNKNIFVLLAGVIALSATILPAHAQGLEDRVVAVVNDQVLTLTQLETRANLAADEMGLDKSKMSAAQRAALQKRTLTGLIDEILVSDAATQRGLSVSPQELLQARATMIKNGVPEARIVSLEKNYKQTFVDKLKADLLWQKTVESLVRPRINIGTAEIDRVLENMLQNRQVVEREIGHIMVKAGTDDAVAQKRMEEILKQLEGGTNFEELAKTASEDESTSANGGYMGWFESGQLNPELELALDRLKAGDYSGIIRTPDGWHILKLLNSRSTKALDVAPVRQYQMFLIAYEGAQNKDGDKALDAFAKEHNKAFDVAAAFEANPKAGGEGSRALGWVAMKDMAPEWQAAVKDTKIGAWSPLTVAGKTVGRVYVAETREIVPQELTALREKVNQQLYGNRMELETRRYLRELRQRAFVDVRL